jgi:hypothetical protein
MIHQDMCLAMLGIVDIYSSFANLPVLSPFYKYSFWLHCYLILTSFSQDKTNSVIDLYRDISRAVDDLATCTYSIEAFTELLSKIQAAVSPAMLLFGDFDLCSPRLIV